MGFSGFKKMQMKFFQSLCALLNEEKRGKKESKKFNLQKKTEKGHVSCLK